MKRIVYILCAVIALVGCSKSGSSSSSGNVASVTITSGSSSYIYNFDYNSSGKVSALSMEYNGNVYEVKYKYSSNSVTATFYEDDYDSDDITASLNSDGTIKSIDYDGDLIEYSYSNGELTSATEGSSTWYVTWENGNMTETKYKTYTANVYEYSSSILNNASIDLNMFMSNSEHSYYLFYSEEIGFIQSIGGIHSKYMMTNCYEEGYKYDIEYEFDEKGRISQGKWSKYGSSYITADITYY